MTLVSRGVALVALVAAAVGCADGGGTTGPSEEHPAIPQFAEAACAVWSCSIGDCTYDPAIYGACCVEVAEGGLPVASRPSCEGPGGGGGGYCDSGNSFATCLDKAYDNGTSPYVCNSDPYVNQEGFAYNPGTDGYENAFPECS